LSVLHDSTSISFAPLRTYQISTIIGASQWWL
jgi:hypothetical protein